MNSTEEIIVQSFSDHEWGLVLIYKNIYKAYILDLEFKEKAPYKQFLLDSHDERNYLHPFNVKTTWN